LTESDPVGGAAADAKSVAALLTDLVRCPSRGGIDDYAPAVAVVEAWLRDVGLVPHVLSGDSGPVAVVCDVRGSRPGPHLVLDACLDTAGLADESAWTQGPFSAAVVDGWLYGRGAADSKAAVAIFCHLAARLAASPETFGGDVTLLFDLDEHTGGFAGIHSYLDTVDRVDAVMIGYPGPESIVIGGRGFLRAKVSVFGQAGHTGSSRAPGVNALVKAARFVDALARLLPTDLDPRFGLPPKATVTSIRGGEVGVYSVTPDRCEVEVDVRLTPAFDADAALRYLQAAVAQIDAELPAPRSSQVQQTTTSWPAFRLPPDHPLPAALTAGAELSGLSPAPVVAGPSNIGCLLAARGIPATAGFGVRYQGLHGTDEAVELASVPAVQAAYHHAVLALQADGRAPGSTADYPLRIA
jgi:succinyl-diaminopimelate desuccinylase